MNNNSIVKQNKAISMISRKIWGENRQKDMGGKKGKGKKDKDYYKNWDSEIGATLTADVIGNNSKTARKLTEERRTRNKGKGKLD